MIRRTRAAFLTALSVLTVGAFAAPAANANLLSILPGSCGSQTESQPFAQFGDHNEYTPVRGGNFEPGGDSWLLTGHAQAVSGNESFYVGGAGNSHSLSLPAGSSATSPFNCTNIYHPTLRLFARNTGSPSSRLNVYAIYPALLFGFAHTKIGTISATSSWEPTGQASLGLTNLLATLSLSQTEIAFELVPTDGTGNWSVDDVYLDPFCRG